MGSTICVTEWPPSPLTSTTLSALVKIRIKVSTSGHHLLPAPAPFDQSFPPPDAVLLDHGSRHAADALLSSSTAAAHGEEPLGSSVLRGAKEMLPSSPPNDRTDALLCDGAAANENGASPPNGFVSASEAVESIANGLFCMYPGKAEGLACLCPCPDPGLGLGLEL